MSRTLLSNAASYSEPGSRVAVSCRRDGADAVISVADTGVGIAPQALPTVWNLFTQVRDALDKAQGGLGIGLALVKELVEMHGGTEAAASPDVGRGSTFILRLALVAHDAVEEDDRRKTREVGFDGHLGKPVEVDVLMKLLASLSPKMERQRTEC